MKKWKLVRLSDDRKAVPVRWSSDLKLNAIEEITRFNSRLLSKDFMQIEDGDLSEVLSLAFQCATVSLAFAFFAKHIWRKISLDINTDFLNTPMDQEIYVKLPEGFKVTKKKYQVYILSKALYSLQQAPWLLHHHFYAL